MNLKTIRDKEIKGFSLIELIVVMIIISIITFVAVPSILKNKEDAELQTVIARVEALNMAIMNFVNSEIYHVAAKIWEDTYDKYVDDEEKQKEALFNLISVYLSGQPSYNGYIPEPYGYRFQELPSFKVILYVKVDDGSGGEKEEFIYY